MAGSPRAGNSTWWTTIVDLALAAQASAPDLCTNGINRISDRTVWLRDALTTLRSDLAQTSAGTKAIITGSIDLSDPSIVYDPVIGTLNGLTFQLQADTGGVLTVTFGTPTGPAGVVSAINSAGASHFQALEDAAGHLNVYSVTYGGTSTINVVGGSAVTTLGFAVAQNATGVSSGNDGVSRVSGAQIVGSYVTVPAGTLRTMLQYITDHMGDAGLSKASAYVGASFTIAAGTVQTFLQLLADKAAKLDADNTFIGDNTFSGATVLASGVEVSGGVLLRSGVAAVETNRAASLIGAATTAATIDVSQDSYYSSTPTPSGNSLVLTLRSSTSPVPVSGQRIRYDAYTLGINTVHVKREDATELIRAVGGALFHVEVEFTGTSWRLVDWQTDGTPTITVPVQ